MNVKDRIKKFIKIENISIVEFEKSINASNGYVNSIFKSIGLDKLNNIIEKYPNLNIEWLLTGTGKMLKSDKIDIKPVDNEWLLKRFEEVIAENALLKKRIEELELSRGTPPDTPNYDMPEKKLGSFLAAEPVSSKHTR